MNKIEENSLRNFGKYSELLNSLKNIKPSDETKNNIWNNIEYKIDSQPLILREPQYPLIHNLFSYKPYLALAIVIFIGFGASFFFNVSETVTISKNIVNIKMGGTMIPAPETNFNVIKESNREGLVSLTSGELDIYVVPAKKGDITKRFELKTNDGLVIVKGTKFKVTSNKEGTTVFVKKGTVWVEPKGKGRDKIILTKGLSTHILPLAIFLEESKNLGIKAYINKDYPMAKEKLNKYILNKENDFNIITILARIAESEKRYEDAVTFYNRVLKAGSSLEKETAWVAIAVLLKNNKQSDKAKTMFLNYIKKYPNGVFKDDVYKELNRK